jgi:peroxiredoxin
MKPSLRHLLLLSGALLLGALGRAADSLDAELDSLRAFAAGRPPEALQGDNARRAAWFAEHQAEVCRRALLWFDTHATDPRRWQAAQLYTRAAGLQGMDAAAPTVVRAIELIGASKTAADVPAEVAMELQTGLVMFHATRAWIAQSQGKKADLSKMRAEIDDFAGRFPDAGRALMTFEWAFVMLLAKQDEAASVAWTEQLSRHPNPEVARHARSQLKIQSFAKTPPEFSFVDLDGKRVDFAALRGKVVLVDFWATWCGPCVAELPNVLAAYRKHHAEGFEVIGITLDGPKDREKLTNFVTERQLPWPQFLDEENKRNRLAEEWGIVGIPATFLFDRTGRLIAKDVKGEQLLSAVAAAIAK